MLRASSSLLPPSSTSNLPNQQIFEDWLLLNNAISNSSSSISSRHQIGNNNNINKPSSSIHALATHHHHPQKSNDATIRIFISSTFSDMTKERDLIATRVAPRINKFSESLGITTTFVDLRWGVTTEQTEANDTVSVCLDQVLKSDIMIVFCGHRYGWHVCDDVNNNNNNNETEDTTDQNENNRKRRGAGRHNEKNELLTKSILHAAEALSTEEMKWLQPVLALANHNNHKKNHNETSSSSSSASSLLTAKLLVRSSVTELEIRAAFMKERFLNSIMSKSTSNNDGNPKSNIHVFLRTQSLKSETEDCEVARSRLNALRNALSVLPNAKKYDNLSKNNNNNNNNSQAPSDYSSPSTGIIIKNSNTLEEEIFKAICESIFNVFPDRRAKEKPRKWEREGQIQQVLADRSLQGFCEDF